MMRRNRASFPIRQRDSDILHHALILVIEDVAVQDEIAGGSAVAAIRR
jgi:hypothetical protein